MSKRKVLIALGVIAVAGGAAAVAAVSAREHSGEFIVAQMMGDRGDGMGMGPGMGRGGGMRGEGREGRDGMGRGGMRGDDRERGGPGWRGRGRSLTKDEFDARVRERFARIDKNNDGALDRAEIEAHVGQMGQGRGMMRGRGGDAREAGPGARLGGMILRRFDGDNDGKLTRDELTAGLKRDFARFDLDGDGRITDADLPPIVRGQGVLKGQQGQPGMGRGGFMLGRLRAADANNDGVITQDEFIAAAMRRFEQFDRTKDGIIDQADRDQLRKEMTDYRVARFINRFGASKEGRVTREQFAAAAAEQFRMFDANSDGRVDREDRGGMGGMRGQGQGPGRGR